MNDNLWDLMLNNYTGIFVPRIFVSWCPSWPCAALLAQMFYWTKQSKEARWVYKTKHQWEEEIGLGRREQETARKQLIALGFLEESYTDDNPPRLRYRLTNHLLERILERGTQETTGKFARHPGDHVRGTQGALRAHNARRREETTNKTTSPRGSGVGLGINVESKMFATCKKFAQFVNDRHGVVNTDFIIQKRWVNVAIDFYTTQLSGDKERFYNLLQWYMDHVSTDSYLTECQSIPAFCKRFHQIEKARRRSQGDKVVATTIIKKIVGPVRYV